MTIRKIGIFGFGAWGKALLKILQHNTNNDIMIYTRSCCNNNNSMMSNHIIDVVKFCDIAVIATKANVVHLLVDQMIMNQLYFQDCIITSKGFAINGQLLSNIIQPIVCNNIGVLAGPNFAYEILDKKLSIATLSGKVLDIFTNDFFKIQYSDDVIGVQVCSIMKNIYAIGCGIITAFFNSDNMKSAFIAVAFNELMKCIELFGGKSTTINSVSGIGDLILTCYNKNSRNHMFGEMFIKNQDINIFATIEGYSSLMNMHCNIRLQLPLCNAIFLLLQHEISLNDFIQIIVMQF